MHEAIGFKGIVIERQLTNVIIVDQYLNFSTQSIAFLAKWKKRKIIQTMLTWREINESSRRTTQRHFTQ